MNTSLICYIHIIPSSRGECFSHHTLRGEDEGRVWDSQGIGVPRQPEGASGTNQRLMESPLVFLTIVVYEIEKSAEL